MKILLYCWSAYFEKDLFSIFDDENISYDKLEWSFSDKNDDPAFLNYIKRNVSLNQYTLVFSVNYWPLLSIICQENNIPYVCWCYDNPLNVRDIEQTLGNEVNHVYCFDRMQVMGYQNQGFQTVHHLPLGIHTKRLSSITPDAPECKVFQADVSLVGKLYESAATQIMSLADDYCKGYLQALINTQSEIYGSYFLDQALTDEFMDKLNHSMRSYVEKSFSIERAELTYALSCEITRRDRIVLLSLCGMRFDTRLYSYNDSDIIKGVQKCPPVNYWNEMPYVFAASKINLNPCLRAIQTGINLRALDIMACGGFLLSNYQEELAELFVSEEEMVLYESLEDAIAKIQFYLKHEDIREKIALAGRAKTLREHNMKDKLTYMFTRLN